VLIKADGKDDQFYLVSVEDFPYRFIPKIVNIYMNIISKNTVLLIKYGKNIIIKNY
jgi:hypothetical protein